MKSQSFSFLFVIIFVLGSFSSPSWAKKGGTDVGGGGDEVGVEFRAALNKALSVLKQKEPDLSREIDDGMRLQKKFIVLTVETSLPVNMQGVVQQSIAKNYPSTGIIEVHRSRWQDLRDARLKEAIALHEYLSLGGLESTGQYPYSGRYLEIVKGPGLETALGDNRDFTDLQISQATFCKVVRINFQMIKKKQMVWGAVVCDGKNVYMASWFPDQKNPWPPEFISHLSAKVIRAGMRALNCTTNTDELKNISDTCYFSK